MLFCFSKGRVFCQTFSPFLLPCFLLCLSVCQSVRLSVCPVCLPDCLCVGLCLSLLSLVSFPSLLPSAPLFSALSLSLLIFSRFSLCLSVSGFSTLSPPASALSMSCSNKQNSCLALVESARLMPALGSTRSKIHGFYPAALSRSDLWFEPQASTESVGLVARCLLFVGTVQGFTGGCSAQQFGAIACASNSGKRFGFGAASTGKHSIQAWAPSV